MNWNNGNNNPLDQNVDRDLQKAKEVAKNLQGTKDALEDSED
jgi:hypothetical protein